MKRIVLIFLICFIFVVDTYSQTSTENNILAETNYQDSTVHATIFNTDSNFFKLRYGGFGDLGYNFYSANFNQLPEIPNCCTGFELGSGFGWDIGALAEYPITYEIFTYARLSYNYLGGIFSIPEQTTVIVDGIAQDGEFEHYLSTGLSNIELSLLGEYKVWKKLFVNGGLTVGILTSKSFEQKETIINPHDRGTFIDGTRERNHYSGNIQDANSISLAATVGCHWVLPLNKKGSLFLMPEIYYSYYFTPVVSGLHWNNHIVRVGAAVKYKEPPLPPPPPPPPLAPPDPKFPNVPYPPVITANVALIQVDSLGNEMNDFDLKIEDFISLNLRPLLNYIFFNKNSAEIPKRYVQLSEKEVQNFSNKSLENLGVLATYYQILNIVGRRLTESQDSKITLVGTNDNTEEEKGNKELSKRRAEAVKNYLTNIWKIPPDRIKIKVRNLPKDKSDVKTEEGQTENRRVEIYTKDKTILQPVITIDTLRQFRNYRLRFFPDVHADAGLSSWTLNIRQADKNLLTFKGTNVIPDSLDWYITEKDSSAPKKGGKIYYQLIAIDSLGQVAVSTLNWVPVEQITIEKKRLSQQEDKEFEYYSLILFDFGKSKLDKEHKSVLKFVKNRIKPESKITITGYSDKSGNEKVNRRLSFKRAKSVTRQLKLKNVDVNGVGESVLLYNNNLPEGRFYCRTVKITIENPVKIKNKNTTGQENK